MSTQNARSLRARVVFPVDAPPIENGVVTIDDGRVVAVDQARRGDRSPHDLGDVALLPGFVNAHTHLEFSNLSHPLGEPSGAFTDWIRAAISERQRKSFRPRQAIATGLSECLRAGVTSVGEIVTTGAAAYSSVLPHPQLTMFREVIGFSLARADSAFTAAGEQLTDLATLVESSVATQLGVSPHAPYTVSPELVGRLVQLATEQDLPVAMHLAESREELELLHTGRGPFFDLLEERSMWDVASIPPDTRPLHYLQQLARAPQALVVHGNYLAADELDLMAAQRERLTLVHCPRTHAYFGHEPFDLQAVLSRGVRVVLGTDGRASNPDLSLLEELRFVARRHPEVSPTELLPMGTLDAAVSLGQGRSIGSLTVGKLANLVAVPIPGDAPSKPEQVLAAIFGSSDPPVGVWLQGQRVLPPEGAGE